jgi:3-oxoacyl-(acyl-carrier-protein) synthase III
MAVRVIGLSHYFPNATRTSEEVENTIKEYNPRLSLPKGFIQKITGIESRPLADTDEFSSTLAIKAAQKLFAKCSINKNDIDLLIFASATQDLIEPATSHIVQDALGTNAHCFDIKNACNSFINGVEVAEALLNSNRYNGALIVTGEKPSVSFKNKLKDRDDLKNSFAGYTFGDSGSALYLKASSDNAIIFQRTTTASSYWQAGTLPGGGTRHPRGDEYSYFHGGGLALKEAFNKIGVEFLNRCLEEANVNYHDFKKIYIHQVSENFLNEFVRVAQIPVDKVKITINKYGNLAASTLPVGISLSLDEGEIESGDLLLLIGLAGGISLSVTMIKLT